MSNKLKSSYILLLLYPLSVLAGAPGPEVYIYFFTYSFPFFALLLTVISVNRDNEDTSNTVSNISAVILLFYIALFGLTYIKGIINNSFSAWGALFSSVLLSVFIVSLSYFYIKNKQKRTYIALIIMLALLSLNTLTSGIINV